jgi:DNA-binding SARP family transcriptional activator
VVGYRLRMLERDPFDEHSHLALVAGLTALGRHGEALRSHRRYLQRMHQIGIEPIAAVDAQARRTHQPAAA